MELVATFGPVTKHPPAYRLGFLLATDTTVSFGRRLRMQNADALVRVIEKLGGDPEEARLDLRRWGQGSVRVRPTDAQLEWLTSGAERATAALPAFAVLPNPASS